MPGLPEVEGLVVDLFDRTVHSLARMRPLMADEREVAGFTVLLVFGSALAADHLQKVRAHVAALVEGAGPGIGIAPVAAGAPPAHVLLANDSAIAFEARLQAVFDGNVGRALQMRFVLLPVRGTPVDHLGHLCGLAGPAVLDVRARHRTGRQHQWQPEQAIQRHLHHRSLLRFITCWFACSHTGK